MEIAWALVGVLALLYIYTILKEGGEVRMLNLLMFILMALFFLFAAPEVIR